MKNRLEDKILLLQIKAGKEEAFAELYRKYVECIYRFIFFKVKLRQDAEDLAANVFFQFWAYIKEGNEVSSARSFLYRIARNAIVDYFREREDKKPVALDSLNEHVREESLEEALDKHGEKEGLYAELGKLASDYREAVLLKLQGLSHKEIAEVLNRSSAATRVLLHRAVNQLKKIMRKT